ncbi:MAG: thiosulfate oxidation carrier complex protein SoxZ [Sulfuricellaceae bacterium]|nr:thiosulfate oxidation carrier complex protein SoxZ [Sulfuricellaceae bacterium]
MAEATRIQAKMQGDSADIKMLMTHEMETGLRKDAKTGQIIPAHHIQMINVTVGGKTVLDAQWGGAISKNPFLGIKVKGAKAGDKVVVNWTDNKGDKRTDEGEVK